jgi:hypothetical protein
MIILSGTSLAADTHVIVGTQQITWTYQGQKSTPTKPLIVDDLKKGDIVEIKIDPGPIPHGFITVKKTGNAPPVETKDLVWACGQGSQPPNAVLREMDCGGASKIGVQFKGSMRLEVLDTFKDDTDFWCVVHHARMAGTLKLKP